MSDVGNNKTPDDKETIPTISGDGSVSEPGSGPMERVGEQIGPYKLLEVLGEGGYGIVYLAEQQKPIKRRVALKVIKPGMDSKQVIARFEAERQTLALLNHPNIAHIFDAGTTKGGYPYFAMEHVKGNSLTTYCDQEKLSIEQRLELFLQVCEAVHYAHQKGIIHRDIKPSNILVSIEAGKALPKIIDFGVAKALTQPLTERTFFTEQGQLIGTPEYMSPEQAEMANEDIDTRSDIYSLGILLYALLTGTLPFDRKSLQNAAFSEILRIIREEDPPLPSTRLSSLGEEAKEVAENRRTEIATLARRLHKELEWIPLKAMRKERSHRYQSASDLANDIRNYLSGAPLIAGPESASYRFKKFTRKHPTVVGAMVGIVIALSGGLAVSITMYFSAVRESVLLTEFLEHEVVFSEAQQFLSEGQYQRALTKVETILDSERVGPAARLLFGRLLIEVGRYSDAEAELRKLLSEEPKIAGAAHYLLAMIYIGSDSAKAEAHQKSAEKILPRTAEAYCLRAMAASTPAEAVECLSKALQFDPSHYPSRKALALAYYALKDYDKMADQAGVIMGLRKEDSLGYALYALALRETGQPDNAITYHDKAIEKCDVDNARAELHNQRRETHVRMGNYKAALKDARRCVELEPEQFVYRLHVFTALVLLGEYDAAKQEYIKIVHDDILQKRQFEAWAQRHVFKILGAGQKFELPIDIELGEAFSAIQEAADYYRNLEGRAARLVHGVYGHSSWSPDGTQLAYGRSDLYAWLPDLRTAVAPIISRSGGIEILNLETGTTRLLVSFGKDPAWSPDEKYIAFVREPKRIRDYVEEVWIVPAVGGQPRRLALGAWPLWARDSKRLYFHSRVDKALYSIRIDDPNAKPKPIISCPSRFPWISPDEKHVAYAEGNELKIAELPSGRETKWIAPTPASDMLVRWSPNGKELSVAGLTGSDLGLWIFDVEREKAWQIFDAPAISGIWSPDMSKMVIEIKIPFEENWLVMLDPNVPTYQSIASALTCEEYLRYRKEYYMDLVKDDPNNAKICIEKLTLIGLRQNASNVFNDAFMTFTEVDNLHRNLTGESRPVDLKFIVMALHRLGRNREAETALTRMRRLFESGKYPREEKHLYEVEQLFAGDNKKFYRLWEYIGAGQLEEASQLIDELRSTSPGPDTESATKTLARAYFNRGRKAKHRGAGYGETIADYELAVRLDPNFARAFSDLAWLQAAYPATEFCDFTKTVENATKACELTNWKNHHFVGALAAVYAEVGDFAAAIKRQKDAIHLLSVSERPVWLSNYEMRLRLYQSGKRYDKGNLWSFSTGIMVAWWKFDEKSGRIAADSSGNNCIGILMGNPKWQPSGGKIDGAIELDGDGDYIRIGNEAIFDFTDEITVATWVNITTIPRQWTAIVSKGNSAWRLTTFRDERRFHFAVTGYEPGLGSFYVHGEKVVANGQWHHVCGTYDGAYVRLYIDGIEDPASRLGVAYNGPITSNDFNVCIGENSERPGRYWHGLIDDVRIYSYALSENEIKALYGESKTAP